MFQDYGLGSEGDDRRLTGAGVGYAYSFNSISDFLLDFRIADSASADDGDDIVVEVDDPDRTQLDFTAQYNHAFTPVITGSVGYQLTQRYRGPGRRHQPPRLPADRPELRHRVLIRVRPVQGADARAAHAHVRRFRLIMIGNRSSPPRPAPAAPCAGRGSPPAVAAGAAGCARAARPGRA